MRKLFASILFFFALLGCDKSEDFGPQGESADTGELNPVYSGVVVINEGNFGFGNASISTYDLSNNSVQNQVYERANGNSLGDVAQSSLLVDSLLFVVVNNSNKVVVLDKTTFKQVRSIEVPGAPRYLIRWEDELLVSTMGSNAIHSIQLSSFELNSRFAVSGWIEEMIIQDGILYACNRDKDVVEMFDMNYESHLYSIQVGQDPESIASDGEENILVLCTGGFDVNDRSNASIYRISKNSASAEFQFSDVENSPARLRYNVQNDKYYFLNNGLYALELGSEPLLVKEQQAGEVFYGLGINPNNGHLFLTNAVDYVQAGEIWQLDQFGTVVDKATVGIIPQAINFY